MPGFRGFSSNSSAAGSGHIRGLRRDGGQAHRFAREQHFGASDRIRQRAGSASNERRKPGHVAVVNRGSERAGTIHRNTFTQLHNTLRAHHGNRIPERGLATRAIPRELHSQTMANRGSLSTAAFRRGNGFEGQAFGGRHWRGREGRFRHFWAGGVFWPYLFGDYVSYAFWPNIYAEPFWAYGPGAILWGSLWPYEGYGEDIYAGAGEGEPYQGGNRTVPRIGGQFAAPAGSEQTAAPCSGFAPGIIDLPLAQLEQIIQPTSEQRTALDELKAAFTKAARVLQAACLAQTPPTPVARLDAMEQRLEAMLQALTIVRPPLEHLYSLLNKAQIGRLENAAAKPDQKERSPSLNLTELCSGKSGLTNVPADEITREITLNDEQKFDLDKVKQASAKAAEELQASCPKEVPGTIEGRLQDAHRRVAALIQAIETIRPAMASFYASLSNQQKAALNTQAPANRSARR